MARLRLHKEDKYEIFYIFSNDVSNIDFPMMK